MRVVMAILQEVCFKVSRSVAIPLLLLLFPFYCYAEVEHAKDGISLFHSEIRILEDASIEVRELINVHVVSENFDGLSRTLHLVHPESEGFTSNLSYDIKEVTLDNVPISYSIKEEKYFLSLEMKSDKALLSPGSHVFRITYRTNPILGFHSEYDEFLWPINGFRNQFAVEQVSANVTFAIGIPIAKVDVSAYSGPDIKQTGLVLKQKTAEGTFEFVSATPLPPDESVVVKMSWPKGYIDKPEKTEIDLATKMLPIVPNEESKASASLSSVNALISKLSDKKQPIDSRREAAKELSEMGVAAAPAAAELVKALDEDDGWIQSFALFALVDIGEAAVPPIIDALNDPSYTQKDFPLSVLSHLGPQSVAAIPMLIKIIEAEKTDYQKIAIYALGQIGHAAKEAGPTLIRASYDDALKLAALHALGEIRDVQATDRAIEALGDEDFQIRATAVAVLGQIGKHQSQIEDLIRPRLKDNSTPVVMEAMIALDKIESKNKVQDIIPLLKHDDLYIHTAAAGILVEENDPDAQEALRVYQITTLQTLIERLKNGSLGQRCATANALGQARKAAIAALPELRNALKNEYQPLRANAARAIGEMRDAADVAVEDLIEAMNDKYNSVHAAGSLAKIGTPRAIEAVKKSGPDVIRAFKEAMFAMQPEVREEVAIALKAIDSEETRRIFGRYSREVQ